MHGKLIPDKFNPDSLCDSPPLVLMNSSWIFLKEWIYLHAKMTMTDICGTSHATSRKSAAALKSCWRRSIRRGLMTRSAIRRRTRGSLKWLFQLFPDPIPRTIKDPTHHQWYIIKFQWSPDLMWRPGEAPFVWSHCCCIATTCLCWCSISEQYWGIIGARALWLPCNCVCTIPLVFLKCNGSSESLLLRARFLETARDAASWGFAFTTSVSRAGVSGWKMKQALTCRTFPILGHGSRNLQSCQSSRHSHPSS